PQLITIGDANQDGTVSNTDLQGLINLLAAAPASGGGSSTATAQSAIAAISVADGLPQAISSAAPVALSQPAGNLEMLSPSSPAEPALLVGVLTPLTEPPQIANVVSAFSLLGDDVGRPAIAQIRTDASNPRESLDQTKSLSASSVDNQSEIRQLPISW